VIDHVHRSVLSPGGDEAHANLLRAACLGLVRESAEAGTLAEEASDL